MSCRVASDCFFLRPSVSHSEEPLTPILKKSRETTRAQTLNECFLSISVPWALSLCNVQVLLAPDLMNPRVMGAGKREERNLNFPLKTYHTTTLL